jgi:uncharacterized membrane protein YtjA (UPF0391 family)
MSKPALICIVVAVVAGLIGFSALGGPIISGLSKAISAVSVILLFLIQLSPKDSPDHKTH